jgi:transcriptional regulator with XRE-family HTH domain
MFAVTYPPYLREKARKLRADKKLTIDEIAERLSVGRTTI